MSHMRHWERFAESPSWGITKNPRFSSKKKHRILLAVSQEGGEMSWQHSSILLSKITRETFQWNSSKGQHHTTDIFRPGSAWRFYQEILSYFLS